MSSPIRNLSNDELVAKFMSLGEEGQRPSVPALNSAIEIFEGIKNAWPSLSHSDKKRCFEKIKMMNEMNQGFPIKPPAEGEDQMLPLLRIAVKAVSEFVNSHAKEMDKKVEMSEGDSKLAESSASKDKELLKSYQEIISKASATDIQYILAQINRDDLLSKVFEGLGYTVTLKEMNRGINEEVSYTLTIDLYGNPSEFTLDSEQMKSFVAMIQKSSTER